MFRPGGDENGSIDWIFPWFGVFLSSSVFLEFYEGRMQVDLAIKRRLGVGEERRKK